MALVGVLAITAGSAAASNWSVRHLPDRVVLFGVSCPSESLCVAVGALNTVAVSQAPTAGADRWQVLHPTYEEPEQSCLDKGESVTFCSSPRGSLDGVSCAGESLCVAVGYEGSIYVSTDPTGGGGAWSVGEVDDALHAHLTAVSCPSAALCVAVSGGYGKEAGKVVTSTAPASGEWKATQLAGLPDLRGVSCATPSLCVAVAKGGRVFATGDPTGGASAWRKVESPTSRDVMAVSCVIGPLCAAGDAGGNILSSTDPTGGGQFRKTNADGSVQMTGVSCPTPDRCVAVDNNADVLTSIDPTGGPDSWTFENLVPFEAEEGDHGQFVGNALFAVSCGSSSLCVSVGANSRIFTATEPFAAPARLPSAGKPARKRPRTHLVFAEGFWKSRVTRQRRTKARFRFYSRDGARGFICKRDHGHWRPCRSPLRYWVTIGDHVLRVRAIGPTGLRGPAAELRFAVFHPPRR